jgi:hypothetical protein
VVWIGLTPGFVLSWAGTNKTPILKPALLIISYLHNLISLSRPRNLLYIQFLATGIKCKIIMTEKA